MSLTGVNPSLNLSTGSSIIDTSEDLEVIATKNYVKDLLKSRIFLGRYVERRLINRRVGYRDIVVISAAEVELKKDLINAQLKLRSIYSKDCWIGISDSDFMEYSSNVCLATEIDNQPFGPFWFQVKSVKFRDLEIIVLLKCIRHISDAYLEVEPILTKHIVSKPIKDQILDETVSDVLDTFKNALSIGNVKEFVTFVFAFVIAIFTGSTSFVNFLGNFILALIRELSLLVRNSTPMFLGVLDFLSKIVGGFYILLAMFFKPNSSVRPNNRNIKEYKPLDQYHYKNLD